MPRRRWLGGWEKPVVLVPAPCLVYGLWPMPHVNTRLPPTKLSYKSLPTTARQQRSSHASHRRRTVNVGALSTLFLASHTPTTFGLACVRDVRRGRHPLLRRLHDRVRSDHLQLHPARPCHRMPSDHPPRARSTVWPPMVLMGDGWTATTTL